MTGHRVRGATAALLTTLLAAGAGGCSDGGGSGSDAASKAASKAASAAASAGNKAAEALASATAEAGRRLDEVKGGIDAKDDVRLGATGTDGGHSTVTVTADNTADKEKSFAVQVDFRDTGGNLLDVVVVTVRDVAAGSSGEAKAQSNRKLSGTVKTEVARAVRF
ncbi:hypothetical protein JK361_02535 [Streptomyces sp. 5-8]|uniref:Lipoprotein n=1 Tax=Streptomyces musisoli TaxID=2802280 RepID=A0ABS1NTQ9_9ACTN|nr:MULTISPECIES: hypothetical protein [Streptomyces]MBL1103490.1 hypothetical protein [Streptomyces musisoli]MBY8839904.1 hypothetical protein [Streptomyces sp. SP2-10]